MGAAIVLVVAGIAVATVGVLGRIGRLPRNRLAGVRTAATLRSDEAFAVGNRAAAPATVLGGAAGIAGGVAGALLTPPDRAGCILVGAVAMAALAVIGGVQGSRAAERADK